MRKLCLLAALCSPFAHAEVVMVEANTFMRLPATTGVLQLEKLDVADYGTLLIPAGVSQVNIDQLHLGKEALLRELLRGGQVYYLHNDVKTIEKCAAELADHGVGEQVEVAAARALLLRVGEAALILVIGAVHEIGRAHV